jgi:hypothetical protein
MAAGREINVNWDHSRAVAQREGGGGANVVFGGEGCERRKSKGEREVGGIYASAIINAADGDV